MPAEIEVDSNQKQQNGEKAKCILKLLKPISKAEQSKKDLETVFQEVLMVCEQFLYAESEDLLEFLDPVLSDSQCHIHSVLIISKLLQVYDNETLRYNIENLSISDRKLLSYAVLFSILKYEEKDNVGFVMDSRLIDNLGILCSRMNAERKIINQLRVAFNSHSIDYMKGVANGPIKDILNGCDAKMCRRGFFLQLQPCYVTIYTLLKYMEENNLPIVVPFVRFNAKLNGSSSKLSINSKDLLYYEFQKSKNAFVFKCKKQLSDDEKVRPTIAITCFSVINENYPKHFEEYMESSQLPSAKFLTEDCDIRELLMMDAAGHIQLSDRLHSKDIFNAEDSVKLLYKKHSNLSLKPNSTPFTSNFDLIGKNVYGCFEHHYQMAEKFGMVNARYSYRGKILDDSNTKEELVSVVRRSENTFFKVDHVNVSTYARECDLMNSYMVGAGAEVPLIEPENFDKTNAEVHIRSKLARIHSLDSEQKNKKNSVTSFVHV